MSKLRSILIWAEFFVEKLGDCWWFPAGRKTPSTKKLLSSFFIITQFVVELRVLKEWEWENYWEFTLTTHSRHNNHWGLWILKTKIKFRFVEFHPIPLVNNVTVSCAATLGVNLVYVWYRVPGTWIQSALSGFPFLNNVMIIPRGILPSVNSSLRSFVFTACTTLLLFLHVLPHLL